MVNRPRSKPQVLIVEDSAILRCLITAMFSCEDHLQYKIVPDGQSAIEAWEKGNFDIILMDLILPDIDGVEVSKKIRWLEKLKGSKPIPIIAFSVGSKCKWIDKCSEAGIDDFIEKPADIEDVIDIIYKYLPDFRK